MKKIIIVLSIFLSLFLCTKNVYADDLGKNAKGAILMEASTGEIIYKKNENEKLSPASMTKMMSLIIRSE